MVKTRVPIKAPALMGRGGAAEGEGSPAAAGGRAAFPQRKIPPAGEIPTRGKRATFPALLSAKQTKGGRTKNARKSVSPQHFSYHRKASGFRDASRKRDDPELAPTKRRLAQILPERCCSFY